MYFAAISPTELAPILGIVAAMLTGFYALIRFILKQSEKDRDADRKERKELVIAIQDMADSNRAIAEETKDMKEVHIKGYQEAEQRNGHLAEITIQSRDQILSAVGHVKKQHVDLQYVNTENVMNKGGKK